MPPGKLTATDAVSHRRRWVHDACCNSNGHSGLRSVGILLFRQSISTVPVKLVIIAWRRREQQYPLFSRDIGRMPNRTGQLFDRAARSSSVWRSAWAYLDRS